MYVCNVPSRGRLPHRTAALEGAITTMRDAFDYDSPLGILGRLADLVVLERYMRRLLVARNDIIKRAAETETWRRYIRGS
jgi:hypothetical protein